MVTKRKSNNQKFVEAWCLKNEITPEMLDEQYVLNAQKMYQNVIRLIPGKESFIVRVSKNFSEWAWRAIVIQRFIGTSTNKIVNFNLFLLLMLHKHYDFTAYSLLASNKAWDSLYNQIREIGESMFKQYTTLVTTHLLNITNGSCSIEDFPEEATYLESFLATRLYSESSPPKNISVLLTVDEKGVWDNYAALVTDVCILNIYCNSKLEMKECFDQRIIESCRRTLSYLLRKQPRAYSESLGKASSFRF